MMSFCLPIDRLQNLSLTAMTPKKIANSIVMLGIALRDA